MEKHIISANAPMREALRMLNNLSGQAMTLFAVDENGVMKGTVTGGDLRRAFLSGAGVDTPVGMAMHKNFKYLSQGACDVRGIRRCRNAGIRLIPCLDNEGHIISVLDLSKCRTCLPVSAIVMAGGKGERLRPLTAHTPKPLLEVGGKPIIDYNIDALLACGVNHIYITVNYLAQSIEKHVAAKSEWSGKVECLREDKPLGTIGAASLAPLPDDGYTIVTNSDVLTTISYEDMFLHHLDHEADITIAAIPYQVSVPYAILSIDPADQSRVAGLEEKPSYSYFANAGIYIFPNSMLKGLPRDKRADATDLIEMAISQGKKVTYYPINGTWIDIGTPMDFKHASELMKSVTAFNT
ncbi:MAG: nucleotidyltransferase family protein [Clostridium sp.]|nr:nucleotidyltransferase family protein [Clostridium sp.]